MLFKPFQPPSLKKSQPDPSTSQPSKRRKISSDDDDDTKAKGGSQSFASLARDAIKTHRASNSHLGARKPLIPVKNSTSPERARTQTKDEDGGGVEGFYNVLWRKPTAKKHKTWDGDGILSVRSGYAYLQDISGRDMGRIMFNSSLSPGSTLSIGGKDVEIDSLLSKQEFMAGRPFLGAGDKAPAAPAGIKNENSEKRKFHSLEASKTSLKQVVKQTSGRKGNEQSSEDDTNTALNASAAKSQATGNAFKNPLKDSTVMVQRPHNEPTPRHDPSLPGALVMKRPDYVPKGKQAVDVVLDPVLGKHLREHQRNGVKFLYECVMGMRGFNGEGAILADEMGLGKTLQTIALIWTLLKQNPIHGSGPVIKKALIVCPVTLINNWRKEFRKWLGNERIGVFVFDGKRRITDFTKGKSYSVMIIGYERLRTVQEELAKGSGIDLVVADEGHRLKTVQNKCARAIQTLNTSRRVILSGTPIQNDLSEFFAMVDFVNPGLLGTFKMFMKEFEGPIVKSRQPGALKKDIEKGEARGEELRELTSMFILRRTADILSKYLPPKSEYVLFCNPTSTQANIYREVLASPVFQSALGNSESALQLITILKKLCNSPSLLNPKNSQEVSNATIEALVSSLQPNILRNVTPASSGKIRVLDQLLYNLRTTTSEKIVLVSNYTTTLNLLANLLSGLGFPFLRLDGSTPPSKRQGLVDDFNRTTADSCFAFLLSAKAGGIGLNLIGASRLILFDVDWNPATDMQAMARIHRDGQKRHCRIYRILLKGGLEEKIWQRQVTKIGLADSVMEQKGGTAQFSREELRDLFRLEEGKACQTHELLGCECGGTHRGNVEDVDDPEIAVDSADEDEGSDAESLISDPPDIPTLIKASELKNADAPDKPAVDHNRTDPAKPKPKKDKKLKMQSLMQYSHIDPSILSSEESPNEDEESASTELASAIDDDVLLNLLKEEGNRVGYMFKKTSGADLQVADE
ncbi:helicase [Arachnomyces sp. PD_36]|nr:helicase [Arachnomyces sp. PD_36]